MNKNQFEGKLNQVTGDAKIWLGHLTDNSKTAYSGTADKLKGNIKEDIGDDQAKFEKAKNAFETKTEEINNDIQTKWNKFTNEDVKEINGSFETFAAKIKDKYNKSQDEAHTQIREFMSKF